jgi:hypothetical protein
MRFTAFSGQTVDLSRRWEQSDVNARAANYESKTGIDFDRVRPNIRCRLVLGGDLGDYGPLDSRNYVQEWGEPIIALDSGKGSFVLLDPRSTHWEGAKTSEAKWTQGEGNTVTFSGAVEFLIGNVGRDAGTLVLKGKFGTDGAITGEAMFFPPDQDPNDPKAKPSKSGAFKAIRVPAG